MTPNLFAYAMLIVWPLVSLVLFRKLGPGRGLLACLIGGYLLLPPSPAEFNPLILPTLNKETIPSLSALVIYWVYFRERFSIVPRSPVIRILLVMLLSSTLLSILSNLDPLYFGPVMLRGMAPTAALSMTLGVVATVTPFLLARAMFSSEQDHRTIHWALFLAVMAYSLPMLVEVRLSPQLNTWIYGYFQHDFGQMMREGGFRPIVFLYHGLWVAFLAAWGLMAAVCLFRDGRGRSGLAGIGAIWLFGVLVLCKSMASLVYGAVGGVLLLLAPTRILVRLTALLSLLLLVYPALRQAGYVPTDRLVEVAAGYSVDRASSLQFRFTNEDALLERALERPVFGWSGNGRPFIHSEETGRMTSVSDGMLVIIIGSSGWYGYIAQIGLLVVPILMIWWRGGPPPPLVIAGGMLLLTINVIDLSPNATLTPLTWLLAGALLGWAEQRVPVEEPRAARRAAGLNVVMGASDRPGIQTVL